MYYGMIREFKLECKEWKEETEVVGGASFTSRYDIDKITKVGSDLWRRLLVIELYCMRCVILSQ